MDSGIVSTYYSIEEAIDNGAAPIPLSYDRTIDIQRTIDIMDHLLACEVSLHVILVTFFGEKKKANSESSIIMHFRQHGIEVIH